MPLWSTSPTTESAVEEAESEAAAAAGARPARRPRWCWSGTGSRRTPRPRGSRAASRAPTPASATRAAPRSAPRPSGCRRSPRASPPWSPRRYAARWSPPRSSPRGWASTVDVEPGFAEMEFGSWDGLTFAEVAERDQAGARRLARLAGHPATGRRVVPRGRGAGAGRARADPRGAPRQDGGRGQPRDAHQDPGRTALQAPLESVFRMELSPASVTVLSFFPDEDGKAARLDAALQLPAAG